MLLPKNKANYQFNFYDPDNKNEEPIENKSKEQWNPYVNNEGSVMALAGKDFVIAAGDTRLSNGYTIVSRNTSKLYRLTENAILASSGMYADVSAFVKYIKARIEIYKMTNKCEPTLPSLAQLLSVTLYQRRFFPYYAFNVLCGFNQLNEKFVCYGYDAVGSFEEFPYGTQGSGAWLIMPVMDNIYMRKGGNLTEDDAKKLVLETMNGTSCRDIYTGDSVNLMILRRDGTFIEEKYPLRKD